MDCRVKHGNDGGETALESIVASVPWFRRWYARVLQRDMSAGTGTPGGPAMNDTAATAQVIIRQALAWALAVIAAFALDWLMPLPFVPAAVPAGWLGGAA